jgi:hypothetical protein
MLDFGLNERKYVRKGAWEWLNLNLKVTATALILPRRYLGEARVALLTLSFLYDGRRESIWAALELFYFFLSWVG